MTIKTIDLSNFPIKRTIFYLLQDKKERWNRVNGELGYWETRFKKASLAMGDVRRQAVDHSISDSDLLAYFNDGFNKENNILNPAKGDTKEIIKTLLVEKEGDTDILKLLKATAREQQETYEGEIDGWKKWVIGLTFFIDSVEGFYLKDLPDYIKDKLDIAEPVKLEELNQEQLKGYIGEIFATLYTGFSDLERQDQLNDFQQGVSEGTEEIKKLIAKTRELKKPVEPEKPKETETEKKLKEELDKWTNAFPSKDYPKGAETAQELINDLFTKTSDLKTDIKNGSDELKEVYAYIDGLLDRQSQRPVYILTEEPESITSRKLPENPNYKDFEDELTNHPLIREKIQEKINKRKFTDPITISKDKPTPADQLRPVNLPSNWEEQLKEREKLLDKVKELEKTLERQSAEQSRPADQQHPDYENIKAERDKLLEKVEELKKEIEKKPGQLEQKPDSELSKELIKENERLWNHVETLTKIVEKFTPNLKPVSSNSSSSQSASESKPDSSSDQISQKN